MTDYLQLAKSAYEGMNHMDNPATAAALISIAQSLASSEQHLFMIAAEHVAHTAVFAGRSCLIPFTHVSGVDIFGDGGVEVHTAARYFALRGSDAEDFLEQYRAWAGMEPEPEDEPADDDLDDPFIYLMDQHSRTMTVLRDLLDAIRPYDLSGSAVETAQRHVEPS